MFDIDYLKELNVLMGYFSEDIKSVSRIKLLTYLKTENLAPIYVKHQNTIEFGLQYGFIEKKQNKYFITEFGKKYLAEGKFDGKRLEYDLSDKQKKYLNVNIYCKKNDVIQLIKLFKKHNNRYTISNLNIEDLGISINSLDSTGLIKCETQKLEDFEGKKKENYLFILNEDYLYLKQELEKKSISLKELLEKINRQQETGKEAEKYVLEDQIKMVKKINKKLVEKVRQVSEEETGLGYDIESIDKREQEKFIEVKGTVKKAESQEYFITNNELDVANEKRKKYYLALVSEVKNPKKIKVEYIQDPIKTEFKSNICKVCQTTNYENLVPIAFKRKKTIN